MKMLKLKSINVLYYFFIMGLGYLRKNKALSNCSKLNILTRMALGKP